MYSRTLTGLRGVSPGSDGLSQCRVVCCFRFLEKPLQTKGRQAQRVNTVLSDAAVFFEIRICFVLSSYCRARFGFEYASFLILIAGHASDSNMLLPSSFRRANFGFEYASFLILTVGLTSDSNTLLLAAGLASDSNMLRSFLVLSNPVPCVFWFFI